MQTPKPPPSSYARLSYFSVSAFYLVAADGTKTAIRYTVAPDLGIDSLSADQLKDKTPDFLQDEIKERVAAGPIGFKLLAQVAEPGDVVDDNTVHWPESRKVVELGSLTIDKLVEDNLALQKYVIYDPIPRVDGVEPSEDPLLEMRAAVYLLSGRERRAA